jgi:hypothetical protein
MKKKTEHKKESKWSLQEIQVVRNDKGNERNRVMEFDQRMETLKRGFESLANEMTDVVRGADNETRESYALQHPEDRDMIDALGSAEWEEASRTESGEELER